MGHHPHDHVGRRVRSDEGNLPTKLPEERPQVLSYRFGQRKRLSESLEHHDVGCLYQLGWIDLVLDQCCDGHCDVVHREED